MVANRTVNRAFVGIVWNIKVWCPLSAVGTDIHPAFFCTCIGFFLFLIRNLYIRWNNGLRADIVLWDFFKKGLLVTLAFYTRLVMKNKPPQNMATNITIAMILRLRKLERIMIPDDLFFSGLSMWKWDGFDFYVKFRWSFLNPNLRIYKKTSIYRRIHVFKSC